MFDSRASSRRDGSSVDECVPSSLRDVLRAFTLNPTACDSLLNDSSLAELRSESAAEIIRQLKVRANHSPHSSCEVRSSIKSKKFMK